MIKAKDVLYKMAEVYYNGKYVFSIDTQQQLYDTRSQIAKQGSSGFCFHFIKPNGVVQKINSDSKGKLL